MDKKIFFFDIDGTLLSELTNEVPQSAILALKQLQQMGHLPFINTGRTICSLPSELKSLPFAGFICGCGTYISYNQEILLSEHIPHERGREIIRMLKECRAEAILEGEEDCYFPVRQTRFNQLEMTRRYFIDMGLGIETYVEKDNYEYNKFVFYADEQTDLGRLKENLEQDLELMSRGDGFFEAVPKRFSKASAIDFVMEYFHIPKENAYVFGDSSNDLSMFREVGHAIAMEKHDSVLDPYVEYVTKTVEEDGILHALRHYGILN